MLVIPICRRTIANLRLAWSTYDFNQDCHTELQARLCLKKKEKKKVKKIHTFMIHETKRVMTGASLSSVLSVQTPLHACNSNTF